jgi:hypothetical protein
MRPLVRKAFDEASSMRGVSRHPSQFAPNEALWIDGREFAHDHADGVEVRLTRPDISKRRVALRSDPRVELTRGDWIMVHVRRSKDVVLATTLMRAAAAANRRKTHERPRPTPDDAGLIRRRRLHSGKTSDLG